jgi:DNA-binding transcriptional LysR family regulator
MASLAPAYQLDPALLRAFLAVVDAGRISAAARALHLSQPAVTGQIRRLEALLGGPLLLRSARGVEPTAAGKQLIEHARRVLQALELLVESISNTDGPPNAPLLLAASTTIAAHVLPPLLAAYRREHDAGPIRLEVGNTAFVVRRVLEGAVPLGLIEGHARAPGLHLEPFVEDELIAVAAPSLARKVRTLADLREAPLLLREPGSGTRDVVDRALLRAGVRRRPGPADLELGSNEAISGAAVAGLGVAFLSRWGLGHPDEKGPLRRLSLPGLRVTRLFRWALPAGGILGPAARFLRLARRDPPEPPPAESPPG